MLKDGMFRGRQKWQCGVKERARQKVLYADPVFREHKLAQLRANSTERAQARYYARKEAGVCTRCADNPILSETLCWDCLNYMEEIRAISI